MDNYFDTAKNEGYANGQYTRDHNEWRRLMGDAGLSEGGGGNAGYVFGWSPEQWDQAENEALEKLAPYYKFLLDQTGGDVTLAKKRLEEDYERGMRYSEEDAKLEREQIGRDETSSMRDLRGNLNQRNVLLGTIEDGSAQAPTGDYAQKWQVDPLSEKIQTRKNTVERALGRTKEIAGLEKTRPTEDLDRDWKRYQRELGEEKKEKAVDMAGLEYTRKAGQGQASDLSNIS